MKKINTLIAAFALLLSYQLSAQEVTLTTNDMVVTPGNNFQMDVKVADFDDIATAQFAMFWDPAIIEYVGVADFGLPELSASDNFGVMGVEEGKLRFNWIDPDPLLNGVTLDDETVIFSVVFKAVGGAAQSSEFRIDSDMVFPQMPVEVISSIEGELMVNITNSTVTMDGVSSAFETKTNEFVLLQNSPNPFIDETNITFELNHTSNTLLSIHDHTGKKVFEQTKTYSSGSHTVQIARDLFQSAGSYFYTLTTDNATATRQLIVQ